jgi:hypothetical protein
VVDAITVGITVWKDQCIQKLQEGRCKGEVGKELLTEDEDPLDRQLSALLSPLDVRYTSRSNIMNLILTSMALNLNS